MSKRVFTLFLVMILFVATQALSETLPDNIAAIPDRIAALRAAIISSADDMTVTGTSYYVSMDGDDANDGLTPETSWQTVVRVNAAELR